MDVATGIPPSRWFGPPAWPRRASAAFPARPRIRLFASRWPRPRRRTLGSARPAGRSPSAAGGGPSPSGPSLSGQSPFGPSPIVRQVALALAGILAAALGTVFLLDALLWPTLRTLAEAEVQNMATAAMYRAVRVEAKGMGDDYQLFFHMERDKDGQVTFLQPDTAVINDFAAGVAVGIQDEMKTLDGRKVYIPLGRALGSRLLGGVGPRIAVTLYPVMLENVRVWDTFEAAGINQTRHRLYLNVKLTVRTAIPFVQADVPVEGDFPIAEAVIVGKVPQTYFAGAWVPFFPRGEDLGGAGSGDGGD